ncbi:MAG: M3 family metallopeptidase [Crocinitomicaceae bacterium]|nr:M3 family metallopeptidase [Crocinitomicaceae bacterium]
MKKNSFLIIVLALSMTACKSKSEVETKHSENPLLVESTLPYSAPDFSKIKDEHFKPAMEEGMRMQTEAIDKIISSNDAPSFENTILALEESGYVLSKVNSVFFALAGSNTNETLQNLEEEMAPKLSEHSDAIYLNDKLFKRVKEVYEKRNSLDLDNESLKLVEMYYDGFVMAGANLSSSDKKQLKKLNAREASLTTEFNKKILASMTDGGVTFDTAEELKGLEESYLKSIKTEDGKYFISLVNTTQQPDLQNMVNRGAREKLFNASWTRVDGNKNDTRSIIAELVDLRAQKAAILGFPNYASWSLQHSMVKNPENIRTFFDQLIPAAVKKAQEESNEIEATMNKLGEKGKLEPWDWSLYSEKVRKQKYDVDENETKPYFEVMNVLEDGVFFAATKLYGITFKKRTDIPVYHEDVLVYELFNKDGSQLGLFYADLYARPSKNGGAWMDNFVTQSKLHKKKPVIYNVLNIPKPAKGEACLVSFDNVITLFHEFGHALHGFFADQQYPSLSGTAVARDFVEFPSQFNENWATHPVIIKNYAKHYKTGKVIPQTLLDKIKAASTFNEGYSATETIAAANNDLIWHSIGVNDKITDIDAFENEALHKFGLDAVNAIRPRYRSTYFSHIFSGGYAAGYYAYIWTEMLDHDAYQWFNENGGLTLENGQRFRDMVLSRGNTIELEKMYVDWRGKQPAIDAMLKAKGLN